MKVCIERTNMVAGGSLSIQFAVDTKHLFDFYSIKDELLTHSDGYEIKCYGTIDDMLNKKMKGPGLE